MSSAADPGDDTDAGEIEEFELTEGKPLTNLVERRAKKNQDLGILVTDYHNRRGTGKSILTLKLAVAINNLTGGDHPFTREMAHLDPEPFQNAYTDLPKRVPLVLDEAEKDLNKYQAASEVSRAMREIMSMGRIEEKYVIVNLPANRHIGDDLKALFDVWILVQERGRALVHFLPGQPYSGNVLTKKKQILHWEDIAKSHEVRDIYRYLTEEKIAHLQNEGDGDDWVTQEEARDMVERAKREVRKDTRNHIIRSLYHGTDLTQSQIAESLPSGDGVPDDLSVSQEHISDILKNA